jgi:hypothetical protein
MPVGSSVADNFAAGGLASAVSKAGRLGMGVRKDVLEAPVVCHPDTEARIEGETLAGWDEMVALALRAHERATEGTIVGWDVALTPDGPVLVEANLQWCGELVQMAHDLPLGEMGFAEVLLELRKHRQLRGGSSLQLS